MLKGLLSLVNVVEGEETPVLLILSMGFFMGIFLATYKIVATTLFLNDPVLVQDLRMALFLSGVSGVLSTSLYVTLQKRIRFKGLIVISFLSIFLFIALARISYSLYADIRLLKYILFVMLMPIHSIMILGFWGVFMRLFDMGQSKRIISRIDLGQILAFIITTYTIPLLTGIMTDLVNFLIIGEVSMLICIAVVLVIITRYRLSSIHHGGMSKPKAKVKNLIKQPYVVSLALFIFFSMMAATFMDYSFWRVTELQYSGDEKQLASFLGVFEGSVMIIILFLQSFVNDPLIRNFGLRTPILVLPFLLLLFTGLAIFAGHYFGYAEKTQEFIWFFLFITLSTLFTRTLREASENPIFKLFFMPLDKDIRFDAQAKIEGIFLEFTRAFGSGLILLFGYIPAVRLIHYSWFMVVIIIGWIFMAINIYAKYRKELEKILEPKEGDAQDFKRRFTDIKAHLLSRLDTAIQSGGGQIRIFAMNILAKVAPYSYRSKMGVLLQAMQTTGGEEQKVLRYDLAYLELYNNGVREPGEEEKSGLERQDLSHLKHSKSPEDRMRFAAFVPEMGSRAGMELIDLLNDKDTNVVRSALMVAGELRDDELIPFLIESLQNKDLRDPAIESLIQYGPRALPALDNLFYNADHNVDLQKRIVQIYGIMGERALESGLGDDDLQKMLSEHLWAKLSHPNRKIVSEALFALGKCDFTADAQQSDVLHGIIESDIENLVWNFRALSVLREASDPSFKPIIEGISEDIAMGYNHIYLLLLMFFNKGSVNLVRENIESRTTENFSYALELLDVLFEEFRKPKELKDKIIPLLDNIGDIDRVRRLARYYPNITLEPEDIIKQLINRDLNYTNRWTKSCAMEYVMKNGLFEEYRMEVLANLFNPDELLSEIAAYIIYLSDEKLFESYLPRLDRNLQDHLRNIMTGQKYSQTLNLRPHMKYELIKFIKDETQLRALHYTTITNLVDIMEEIYFENESMIDEEIWDTQSLHFMYEGKLVLTDSEGQEVAAFIRSDFIGENINFKIRQKHLKFKVEADTVLLKIEKHDFYEFASSNYETSDTILQSYQFSPRIMKLP